MSSNKLMFINNFYRIQLYQAIRRYWLSTKRLKDNFKRVFKLAISPTNNFRTMRKAIETLIYNERPVLLKGLHSKGH